MLRKRLLAGAGMAAGAGLLFAADGRLAPAYPLLFAVTAAAAAVTVPEFVALLPAPHRPGVRLTTAGVLAVLAANWAEPLTRAAGRPAFAGPWHPVLVAVAGSVVAAFLAEMAKFRAPDGAVTRVAHAVLAVCYLGLLPSFLLRLRWADGGTDPALSAWLLAVTVFVPKCGDIGAYTVGKLVGRTPFAPRLSPKKTWEGFLGGLAASAATAAGADAAVPLFRGGSYEAVGFGVAVGLAGVAGDLAASLVKREAGVKDAARRVPGFGGVLDVMDSVIFAGPVAYLWLARG